MVSRLLNLIYFIFNLHLLKYANCKYTHAQHIESIKLFENTTQLNGLKKFGFDIPSALVVVELEAGFSIFFSVKRNFCYIYIGI